MLSPVTEGNEMIDCCLLEGCNLVLPLRYSPAVNKHPACSEEATVAGEYVNPERLELSRIQGKASGGIGEELSQASPKEVELNLDRALRLTRGRWSALSLGLIHLGTRHGLVFEVLLHGRLAGAQQSSVSASSQVFRRTGGGLQSSVGGCFIFGD